MLVLEVVVENDENIGIRSNLCRIVDSRQEWWHFFSHIISVYRDTTRGMSDGFSAHRFRRDSHMHTVWLGTSRTVRVIGKETKTQYSGIGHRRRGPLSTRNHRYYFRRHAMPCYYYYFRGRHRVDCVHPTARPTI